MSAVLEALRVDFDVEMDDLFDATGDGYCCGKGLCMALLFITAVDILTD